MKKILLPLSLCVYAFVAMSAQAGDAGSQAEVAAGGHENSAGDAH